MSVPELGRLSRTVGSLWTGFCAEIWLVILILIRLIYFHPNMVCFIFLKKGLINWIVQMYSSQL